MIKLSQRNLLTLLHKLQMPGSRRIIIKPQEESDSMVLIQAITDEEAYKYREPGEMHPETEAFIKRMETILEAMKEPVDAK